MHSNRFLSAPALAGLKDFQRKTVEYVFKRLYGNDPTSRFLIADEVGLGKTLVARGIIAKTLEHLQDEVDRVDVIYICSNAAIATQNVNRHAADLPAQTSAVTTKEQGKFHQPDARHRLRPCPQSRGACRRTGYPLSDAVRLAPGAK